jgi:tRNA 5-methylaminomethyl-2-thiouridine biosynthesis bifunctional protein
LTPAPAGLHPGWRPERAWQHLQTDFGGGLGFLNTWASWRQDEARPGLLHVVALLAAAPEAQDLLSQVHAPTLGPLATELGLQCRGLLPGVHRLSFEAGQVLLTLLVGQPWAVLREQELQFDSIEAEATYAPEEGHTRPWLQQLARCCKRGTQLRLSWPSASDRRAWGTWSEQLQACGFRIDSDGHETPTLQAEFAPAWQARNRHTSRPKGLQPPGRCTVIGAGLAGAACAASLARRGWQVTVLDRQGPAAGASGLPVGLMAPHVSPDDSPLSRLSRAGLRATLHQARLHLQHGQDWAATGVLQRRLTPGAGALPPNWPEAGRHWSEPASPASALHDAPGLPGDWSAQALWHASGAWIKPDRLIAAWLMQPGINLLTGHAHRLQRSPQGLWQVFDAAGQLLSACDTLIVANAHHAQALLQGLLPGLADARLSPPAGLADARLSPPAGLADAHGLGLQAIRGQVSWAMQAAGESLPPWPVNGHGSLVPNFAHGAGSAWLLGATFERDDTGCDLRAEGHAANLEKLRGLLPHSAASLEARFAAGQVQGWAGVRCAWRDHLPVVGPLASEQLPGLWLCTAFGSRGLSYSALCAELLAAWLHGEPLPLEPRLAQALRASRLLQAR